MVLGCLFLAPSSKIYKNETGRSSVQFFAPILQVFQFAILVTHDMDSVGFTVRSVVMLCPGIIIFQIVSVFHCGSIVMCILFLRSVYI
jgi:hypothetical protein